MSETTPALETKPKAKTARLTRQILKWVVLGLLLTCIMAAIRKFGG